MEERFPFWTRYVSSAFVCRGEASLLSTSASAKGGMTLGNPLGRLAGRPLEASMCPVLKKGP